MYLTEELCWLKLDDLEVVSVCLPGTAVPARPRNWGVMGQKYKQLLPWSSSIGKAPHSFAFSQLSLQQQLSPSPATTVLDPLAPAVLCI